MKVLIFGAIARTCTPRSGEAPRAQRQFGVAGRKCAPWRWARNAGCTCRDWEAGRVLKAKFVRSTAPLLARFTLRNDALAGQPFYFGPAERPLFAGCMLLTNAMLAASA